MVEAPDIPHRGSFLKDQGASRLKDVGAGGSDIVSAGAQFSRVHWSRSHLQPRAADEGLVEGLQVSSPPTTFQKIKAELCNFSKAPSSLWKNPELSGTVLLLILSHL